MTDTFNTNPNKKITKKKREQGARQYSARNEQDKKKDLSDILYGLSHSSQNKPSHIPMQEEAKQSLIPEGKIEENLTDYTAFLPDAGEKKKLRKEKSIADILFNGLTASPLNPNDVIKHTPNFNPAAQEKQKENEENENINWEKIFTTPEKETQKEQPSQENHNPTPKPSHKPYTFNGYHITPKWKGAPKFNMAKERENVILDDMPGRFEIKTDPKLAKVKNDIWYEDLYHSDTLGKKTVQMHDMHIREAARAYSIDPDLIRAVMFAENARGYKGGMNKLADDIGLSTTKLPMNINASMWHTLIGASKKDISKPKYNIYTSAKLLSEIQSRIENPTVAKVGSIWNYMGRENTNEFGHYIERVYKQKKWKGADK